MVDTQTAVWPGSSNAVFRRGGIVLVLVLLALEVVGCTNGIEPVEWPMLGSRGSRREPKATLQVIPRNNRDVANLSPDDIINVMEQVGFSDEQILALGPDLHEALLTLGAAAITYGREAEVVYAVNGEHLFIQSRTEGTFIYNITNSRFGLMPPTPGEKR